MHFPQVEKLFDDTGKLLEPDYRKYIETSYKELIWMARVLKWGRENLK
jgi:hypothetical protein